MNALSSVSADHSLATSWRPYRSANSRPMQGEENASSSKSTTQEPVAKIADANRNAQAQATFDSLAEASLAIEKSMALL